MKERNIDLKSKKTEHEWQKTLDEFWLSATPQWFTWLGWITILGVLRYLDDNTNNTTIALLNNISYLFFFMYFIAYFYQFRFLNIPLIKSEGLARAISLLISGILSYGVFVLLQSAMGELGKIGG